MGSNTLFKDLGLIPYQAALDYQEKLFDALLDSKKQNDLRLEKEKDPPHNTLIFCEHPHVYTLEKSGDDSNLLINALQLQTKKAEFIKTNRGGDITYHGPGQLVGYPILDLEKLELGTRTYIEKMEGAIILTLKEYGIESYKKTDSIGVWLSKTSSLPERKIAAIGVKISRQVSMHGFALNVNTELDYFNFINPCGFIDKGVSSMEKELGVTIDLEAVKTKLLYHLTKELSLTIHQES